MKCPKCGKEEVAFYDGHCADCYNTIGKKPNPSTRDIFQHIKTDCERGAFDEFMSMGFWKVPWDEPLSDKNLSEIKNHFSEYWRWLQQKGLVQKEKEKREAWSYSYWSSAIPKTIFAATGPFCSSAQAENAGRANTQERFIKTILLHSWEEEK